jgi:hypothetical protein
MKRSNERNVFLLACGTITGSIEKMHAMECKQSRRKNKIEFAVSFRNFFESVLRSDENKELLSFHQHDTFSSNESGVSTPHNYKQQPTIRQR